MKNKRMYITLYKLKEDLENLFKIFLTLLSPEINTRYCYWRSFKRRLDLNNPITSNEKILWLKLNTYLNNSLVIRCADKCEVRNYVKENGCKKILVKKIGEYVNAEEIPFINLPEKFVIKSNYGCALNLICKDKSKLDVSKVIKELRSWKNNKQHLIYSEMQYANIKRKYLIEEYLDNNGNSLDDYKLYCCNGIAYYVMVCMGREESEGLKFYYFDRQGNLQRQLSQDGIDAPDDFSYQIPEGWDDMFKYAEILTKPFPFVRCDFYLVNGKVYFGELTFTPCAGLDNDKLPIADKLIGDLIKLPLK